jgi:HK97 family phage portal protein
VGKLWHWLKATETIPEQRDVQWGIGDVAFADWLLASSAAGVSVSESTTIGLSSAYRAVDLLGGVIGSLPLKSYRTLGDSRERVATFLDNPCPDFTQMEWTQLVVTHRVLRGNAYLLHIYGGAGQLMGLQPIHPGVVTVKWDKDLQAKVYTVTIDGVAREFTSAEITHIHGMSLDGLTGLDPVTVLRDTFGTSIAGNRSAAKQFKNGSMLQGIVTTLEDVTEDEAKIIKNDLNNRMRGVENSGDIAFVNRSLKFDPWQMSNEDAQFLESRTFQIDEIARIFGLPKVLLAQDGASTWGSGIAELIRGMQKFTLVPITTGIEQRVSMLLGQEMIAEYEYKSLFQGTPQEEIDALIKQKEAGILTVDEIRRIMNLAPLPESEEAPGASDPEPQVRMAEYGQPLSLELRQEPTVVNVPAPVVNVNVDPTPVNVQVESPTVNVESPTVNVRNDVQVPPPGDKKVTFNRDGRGFIQSAEIEDEE